MPKTARIPAQNSRQQARDGLPPAGDWTVVGSRSSVSFSGRASRLAPTVRAAFGDVRGGLHLAEDPNASRVGVCVDVRTVSTGNAIWDDMLRGADPFRARQHPLAHYVSSAVSWTGDRFQVEGMLELAGVQLPLRLDAVIAANPGDIAPSGVTLTASGTIDPRKANIRFDVPGARLLMPRTMQLSIAVVAVAAAGTNAAAERRRFALAS